MRVNLGMLVELRKPAIEFHQSVNERFKEICSPLHDLGIKGYCYFQTLKDGAHLLHFNNFELAMEQYTTITNEGKLFTSLIENSSSELKYAYVMGDIGKFDSKNDAILLTSWRHNHWNILTTRRLKNDKTFEGWAFSLGRNFQNPQSFFEKRIDLIKRFIAYFEIVGADLIDMSDRKKLLTFDQRFCFHKNSEDAELVKASVEFLRKTSLKGLAFQHKGQVLKFTKRQGQCLYYLAQNSTIKEIARILDISPRTVEGFLQTLKDKTQLSTKRELINLVNDNKWKETLSLLT